MIKVLTKSDIFLIIFFIIIAISLNFILLKSFEEIDVDNANVVITIDGDVKYKLDLNKDEQYEIVNKEQKNIVRIKNGSAKMMDANCSDGLCLYQSEISYGNESIICLPHKLIVTIENVEYGEIDTVVQ